MQAVAGIRAFAPDAGDDFFHVFGQHAVATLPEANQRAAAQTEQEGVALKGGAVWRDAQRGGQVLPQDIRADMNKPQNQPDHDAREYAQA